MDIKVTHKRTKDKFHRLEQPSLLDWWVERMKAVVAPRRRPAAWTAGRNTKRWPGQLASA